MKILVVLAVVYLVALRCVLAVVGAGRDSDRDGRGRDPNGRGHDPDGRRGKAALPQPTDRDDDLPSAAPTAGESPFSRRQHESSDESGAHPRSAALAGLLEFR